MTCFQDSHTKPSFKCGQLLLQLVQKLSIGLK